jgi:hypothetical protein
MAELVNGGRRVRIAVEGCVSFCLPKLPFLWLSVGIHSVELAVWLYLLNAIIACRRVKRGGYLPSRFPPLTGSRLLLAFAYKLLTIGLRAMEPYMPSMPR